MKLLRFDETIPNLKGALLQIFGNTLIPQDLEIGHEYAMRDGFQCVTLSGDIVTAQGAIDGGYNEGKYRRLKYFEQIRELDVEKEECLERILEGEKRDKELGHAIVVL